MSREGIYSQRSFINVQRPTLSVSGKRYIPKTNRSLENGWLELSWNTIVSFWGPAHVQVLCLLVSLKNHLESIYPSERLFQPKKKKKTPCDFSGSIGLEVPRWMGGFFHWKNPGHWLLFNRLTRSGEQLLMLAGIESW